MLWPWQIIVTGGWRSGCPSSGSASSQPSSATSPLTSVAPSASRTQSPPCRWSPWAPACQVCLVTSPVGRPLLPASSWAAGRQQVPAIGRGVVAVAVAGRSTVTRTGTNQPRCRHRRPLHSPPTPSRTPICHPLGARDNTCSWPLMRGHEVVSCAYGRVHGPLFWALKNSLEIGKS